MSLSRSTALIAFIVDLVLVLIFVLIGRAAHEENPLAGVLTTLWPFAVGMLTGHLVWRAWRYPLRPVRVGVPIWLTTVAVGMLLRSVSGQGVALAFVIVAVVALGVFLVGWRIAAQLATSRRRHLASTSR